MVISKAFICSIGGSTESFSSQAVVDVISEQPGGKNVLHIIQLSNLRRPPALQRCLQLGSEPPPALGIMIYGWPFTLTSLQEWRKRSQTCVCAWWGESSSRPNIREAESCIHVVFEEFEANVWLCSRAVALNCTHFSVFSWVLLLSGRFAELLQWILFHFY